MNIYGRLQLTALSEGWDAQKHSVKTVNYNVAVTAMSEGQVSEALIMLDI